MAEQIVALTRPIKHLNVHQYKTLRRKANAADELTRLGVSCARAEHKRSGKYDRMENYDKNLKSSTWRKNSAPTSDNTWNE